MGKSYRNIYNLGVLFYPHHYGVKIPDHPSDLPYFVDYIYNLTGLNKYLVKTAVILLLGPFIIGIRLFLSPFNKKKRYTGAAILVILLSLYNIGLYHFTRDSYFAFSEGKVLKWYALTPDGVRFFDGPGTNPVYGIPLKPVTPDVIRNLKLLQKGEFRPVNPDTVQFFNPITGEVQVWYYQYPDGSLEFYNKPGYHPITGEPLKPVTKQIYFEWKERTNQKAKSTEAPQEIKKRGESEKPSKEQIAMGRRPPVIDEKERRLNEFRALINNRDITSQIGKPNVAVIIESKKTESGFTPENILYDLLRANEVNVIINFFKEEQFKSKGFFKDIYNGDTAPTKGSTESRG
ncbi:MAG: hypothetical protein Fur0020_01570 [Thermodesulfovibrionia bacterium]